MINHTTTQDSFNYLSRPEFIKEDIVETIENIESKELEIEVDFNFNQYFEDICAIDTINKI